MFINSQSEKVKAGANAAKCDSASRLAGVCYGFVIFFLYRFRNMSLQQIQTG